MLGVVSWGRGQLLVRATLSSRPRLPPPLSFTLDVAFPDIFVGFLEWINVISFDLFGTISLGCLELNMPVYLAYVLIASITPLLIIGANWLVYFARLVLNKGKRTRRQHEQLLNQHIGVTLVVTYLVREFREGTSSGRGRA